jgi:Lon-like ATP-dependent protease
VATAVYSAIVNIPVHNAVAMTGEVSIRGNVRPIGGVVAKVEAARQAGAKKVIIPKDNWQDMFREMTDIQVIAVEHLDEVIKHSLTKERAESTAEVMNSQIDVITASPL